MKKRIIILMAALAVIASIGLYNNTNQANAAEEGIGFDTSKLVEEIGARTETSKSYQLDNGQTLLELFDGPVHYLDSDGKYQDIELDLVQTAGSKSEQGYSFKNKANGWSVSFANGGKGVPMVQIEKEDVSLGFSISQPKAGARVTSSSAVAAKGSDYHSTLSKETNVAYYEDVYDGIDLAYHIGITSVKEEIVINQYTGINSFDFELSLNGLTPKETESNWAFFDKSGNEVFGLAGLFMEDANGKYNDNIKLTMNESDNGKWIMTVTLDEEYLKANDTIYPVVVDPSITITGPSTTYDTYVYSKSPTTNTYTSTYLKTGYTSSYYKRRTYINFNMSALPSNASVSFASLKLYVRDESGTHNTKASKVTSSWSSSGITWNNQSNCTSTGQASAYRLNGIDYFTVTSIVQSWAPVYTNDYGFRVWDSTAEGSTATNYCDYYSSDYSSSLLRPRMNITYTSSSPTATPTPTAMPTPDQYVDLIMPCDGAYRLNNSNWQDDAQTAAENADDYLYSNFKIDFYYKTYLSWTSPADICGDAPNYCEECSCSANCPNCTCDTPGHCSDDCYCAIGAEGRPSCKYYHNDADTMKSSALNLFTSMDLMIALTNNQMYMRDFTTLEPEKIYGYGYEQYGLCLCQPEATVFDNVPSYVPVLHEVSHCYGCSNCSSQSCIMYYYTGPGGKIIFGSKNGWCSQCSSTIMSNRTRYGSTTP